MKKDMWAVHPIMFKESPTGIPSLSNLRNTISS
jgi:hypothetical protein